MRISDWSSDVCSSDLERLGDVLAQLRKIIRPTARACRRRRHDDALARQVLGKRAARGTFAQMGLDGGVPGGDLAQRLILAGGLLGVGKGDRKSTRLNSSH